MKIEIFNELYAIKEMHNTEIELIELYMTHD